MISRIVTVALIALVALMGSFSLPVVGFHGYGTAHAGVISKAVKARIAYGIGKSLLKNKIVVSAGKNFARKSAVKVVRKIDKPALRSAGSIRNVNPRYGQPGFTQNCVNCTIATDHTLAGRASSAMPTSGPVSVRELTKHLGGKFGPPHSYTSMQRHLSGLPDGSRGAIVASQGNNVPGHAFNFVKQRGKIQYLDGQTGKSVDFSSLKTFQVLRTK